jgi:serine/threonine-protein kinase HipA
MFLPQRITQLNVDAGGRLAGTLSHHSVYDFQPNHPSIPVSLTMTSRHPESITNGALHPIFSQNLPEGYNRRYIETRLAREAKVDDMYLLWLQGQGGVGMLGYSSEYALPPIVPMSLDDILHHQGEDTLFVSLLETYYLRNSLAGVQPKVAIPRSLDRTVMQTDLIVKSSDREYPQLTVNEYVCMQAAKHCQLDVPETYLSDDHAIFVIERFDKPNGIAFGFEDFTTLMGRPNTSDGKYIGSYESLLKATKIYTNDHKQVEKIYQYIVFNCLIGNGDAHLKNFALQYPADHSRVFLSPIFDVTHTLIYPPINNKMALKMGTDKAFPDHAALIKLASTEGIKIRNAATIIEHLADGIAEYLAQSNEVNLVSGLKESILANLRNCAVKHPIKPVFRHSKKRKFDNN